MRRIYYIRRIFMSYVQFWSMPATYRASQGPLHGPGGVVLSPQRGRAAGARRVSASAVCCAACLRSCAPAGGLHPVRRSMRTIAASSCPPRKCPDGGVNAAAKTQARSVRVVTRHVRRALSPESGHSQGQCPKTSARVWQTMPEVQSVQQQGLRGAPVS